MTRTTTTTTYLTALLSAVLIMVIALALTARPAEASTLEDELDELTRLAAGDKGTFFQFPLDPAPFALYSDILPNLHQQTLPARLAAAQMEAEQREAAQRVAESDALETLEGTDTELAGSLEDGATQIGSGLPQQGEKPPPGT